LPACAWFFLAQRHARIGQFEPFSPAHAVALLARDSGAAIFGGLPLYAGHFLAPAPLALALLLLICLGFAWHRRHPHAVLFALLAIAPPCGLFILGLIFGNTPIEIGYLAFSTPYLALLLAPALPRLLLALMLSLQTAGILGLAIAPATMQPQAQAARQAAAYPNAVIELPYGNDGVGIPGLFIAAAPDNMRLTLLRPGAMPRAQAVVVTLAIDNESRAFAAATGCPSGVSICRPR
jgi:hypothetical protein